ncbi:MAG: hypothetical protein HY369_05105 [Candidatus Aenigmarchaeota archaeon]|nr:hypothetical protein [Candidatus Aenigmarchaeota archaeon]
MDVYIGGVKHTLRPQDSVGKGGEADVYRISGSRVVKVFKAPDHPDYANEPGEQAAARQRLAEHQDKLPAFPRGLPARVIAPEELATSRDHRIVGYAMPFVDGAEVLSMLSERSYRAAGFPTSRVLEVFTDLHGSVAGLHQKGVVIGDCNDLNVLVKGSQAFLIDADSFQFGRFLCRLFTARFVDPLLCDPRAHAPMLIKPHTELSDWYAFTVMVMQSLLFVDPYGGVYRPRKGKPVPHGQRPLLRITVFHPEVRYPKPAVHYRVLPDDLLHLFHQTFEKDQRQPFPVGLLQHMRWTACAQCGLEHARSSCPQCGVTPPAAVVKEVIRGTVKSRRIFTTEGLILFAAHQGGKLRWLVHEKGAIRREDGAPAVQGDPTPQMRFRIRGDATLIGAGDRLLTLLPGQPASTVIVDQYGQLPVFDANEQRTFWLRDGNLLREGRFGPETVGTVLARQTLFWAGPSFGFGFYRAGQLCVGFVFDADARGINDSVQLPPIRGQLVDSTCVFGKDCCWFLVSTRHQGRTVNQCVQISRRGAVLATAEAEAGDGSWLGSLRGKCGGTPLFSATDDGIVRIEAAGTALQVVREFPDTEPFVDAGSHLFPAKEGIYVVGRQEIHLLTIG